MGLPSTDLQSIHPSPCTWLLYKTRNCQLDIPTTGLGHAFGGEQKMSLKTKPPVKFILIPNIFALSILLWSPNCLQPWAKLRDEWRRGETLYSRCTRKRWESTGRLETRWVNRDVAWLGSQFRQAIYVLKLTLYHILLQIIHLIYFTHISLNILIKNVYLYLFVSINKLVGKILNLNL